MKVDPKCLEFAFEPADRERDGDAATRQPVDRRQRLRGDDRMLQRQDVDAAVDADAFSRAGETGHAGVRVEVMRSGQLDVLGRHDMMLGYRNHLVRSEEHTSELQSLLRISYAVFCLNKNIKHL